MPELVLTNNETGKDETFNTDDFGEDAKMSYRECVVVEKELKRHKFLAAILEDRKKFLLARIYQLETKET